MALVDVKPQIVLGQWIGESILSILTVVTTGTNPYSCARLRWADAADITFFQSPVAGIVANEAYVWIMFWWWYGTAFSAGEHAGIWCADGVGEVNLRAEYNAGGFTVNLQDGSTVLDTGSTVYSTGASSPHLFIIRYNTSTRAVDVWIDHALELSGTDSVAPAFRSHRTGRAGSGGATGNRDWAQFVQATSPNATDIDPTTMYPEVLFHSPDGNGDTSQFGDQTDCTTSTTGVYTNWDDWAAFAANDGDTTFNCGEGGTTAEEISTLSNATYQNTILGVFFQMYVRQTAGAAKALNHDAIIRQNATSRKAAFTATIPTSYGPELAVFYQSPDASAWDQTIVNALQAGVGRAPTPGADANLNVTALAIEGVAIGTVAPSGFEIVTGKSLVIPRRSMQHMLVR